MAFATIDEVRSLSTIDGLSSLTELKLNDYIDRANAYLRRYTGVDYRETTEPDLLIDLRRATILLVEYLFYLDQQEVKESNFSGLESERIGSYSYNKGEKRSMPTGHEELDAILASLRVQPGFNLFSVNGPSDRRHYLDNPHAYVTGYWRKEE